VAPRVQRRVVATAIAMSVRPLLALTLLAAGAAACGVAEVGDASCLDDCDGDVYRDRAGFAVVVVGEPVYLCAAGVVDARCRGARLPLAAETRTEAGDGGQRGAVLVEDIRVLAPVDRRVRVHEVAASADLRAGFDLGFRIDGDAGWRSVTPHAHDWSEVVTEVTDAGPVTLTGVVSCRVDGCVDAVGQGSYLGPAAPDGASIEYRLAIYPIAAAPGTGYDIAYVVD
jgi:hypothetical protein